MTVGLLKAFIPKTGLRLRLKSPIKLFRFLKQTVKRGKGGFKNFYGRGKLAVGLKYKELDCSRNCYKNLLQPFANKVCIVKTKKDLQFFIKSLDV